MSNTHLVLLEFENTQESSNFEDYIEENLSAIHYFKSAFDRKVGDEMSLYGNKVFVGLVCVTEKEATSHIAKVKYRVGQLKNQ